ncbi:MAG TPA: methylenetetrahydrofolate reductase C-terminal domain-containing protein [Anaerolineales bacterium]|nr:methylenetetrahydrofolate reductase C-terminal domain-containing protein [Anaerolineales bacterium]
MLRWLQDSPHWLEFAYRTIYALIRPFRPWLRPASWAEKSFIRLERLGKGALFDCRMCGQCVLHSTGMTCPMTCPKNMRNGPCGGVHLNGNCEVLPDQLCIWVLAWERSKRMPVYGQDILHIQPPLNNQLRDTSAWINDLHLNQQLASKGWDE